MIFGWIAFDAKAELRLDQVGGNTGIAMTIPSPRK